MAKNKNTNNEIDVINTTPNVVTPEKDVEESIEPVTEPVEVAEKETPKVEIDTLKEEPQQPVYEEYETHEVAKKPKKRFKKRYLVIAAAVIALGVFGYTRIAATKNAVVMVETQPAAMGTIENILSISGTVQSAETKTYFSDITAPIAEVPVKVGDKVSKGDVLCTYDAGSIELSEKTAELAIKQAKNSYGANFTGSAAADREYAQGMNAQQINERLDAITAQTDAINNLITEKKSRMNQTLTDLQKTLYDINQNGIADSQEYNFDNGNLDYIYRNEKDSKKDGEWANPSESNRQMYLALQQSIQDVQYALSNDPEIKKWNDQITALGEEKSHLQTAKASLLNSSSIASAKAQLDSTELTQQDTIDKLEAAKEGIKADFNGVVTAVSAVEGATVQNGAQLITLANLDDVEVTVQVSKSDLPKISIGQQVDITINNKPYEGEISKISGTATKNNNGVAVVDTVIKVKKPDSDIILGVEASNKIHAQKAENTLVLPYEYIQTDSSGDFVYVVEDGLVARREVTLGITSSTEAQVVSGLSAGENIIVSDTEILTEGMPVVAMEQ